MDEMAKRVTRSVRSVRVAMVVGAARGVRAASGAKAARVAEVGRALSVVALAGMWMAWGASGGAAGVEAGVYHVYSCRTPGGGVAPTDGWTGSVAPGGAYDDYALNTCASGGALIAALGDATQHAVKADRPSWKFSAPNSERIAAATIWRAGDNAGGYVVNATYEYWLIGSLEAGPFDSCIDSLECKAEGDFSKPLSSTNRVVVPAPDLGSSLEAVAYCGGGEGHTCEAGKGDANGYASAIYLYAADILLEQSAGPTASNVSGELASAPTVRGTSDVAFDATDPASGVYEAVFAVDGDVVQRTVVDENGGRCRDVGGTGDGNPAFLYTQPCKQSVSVDVPFDTTMAPDGAHHLVVSVIDAAGNAAPVLDRWIEIANPPPAGAPNGVNASAQATLTAAWVGGRGRTRIASPYGRAHTIAGQLIAPGGAPIAGARIDCTTTPSYQGAHASGGACARTDALGRFTIGVGRGAGSRTIVLAYRAHLGDTLPAATRTLGLGVRAGVRLRVSPHVTSVGHTIHFTGRLLGGPIPRGGKQVLLEARSPGGPWIEFDVVRSDRRGRYRDSYTFKFPGPVDYRFRAVCEAEADYPYATGPSNVVRVHER